MKINLPISIVIIGIIIAGGIYFSNIDTKVEEKIVEKEIIEFSPITSSDNILGNPNAKVKIIEYSDFSCNFCKEFHPVMTKVMDKYAKTGQVAWVFRHVFSPSEDNSISYQAAMASECVKEVAESNGLKDSETFWQYISEVFENAPTSLSLKRLTSIAGDLGIPTEEFQDCISAERYADKINNNINDIRNIATKLGGSSFGTPYVLVISDTGLQTQIIGSQTYQNMIELIDIMLNQ
jgi:protein-disulfide isomerase